MVSAYRTPKLVWEDKGNTEAVGTDRTPKLLWEDIPADKEDTEEASVLKYKENNLENPNLNMSHVIITGIMEDTGIKDITSITNIIEVTKSLFFNIKKHKE
ncbi:uncharacterized protein LOC108101812 [Drosophila ficusphila]|uniref:uncharacterized protein LOC108101812 n=1 Tax=Drosophila ficusphila TaxID=30025 RepID=UPI0007E78847|nr:uncharacterized protein LOC108101812 [Drosophila ficusphila]